MAGQSIAEVRSLLAAAGLSPRHRLGQNFLIDLNLMRKVVQAAAPRADDLLLEVGPGTGSLTELLLERGARVIACELDRGLAELLRQRFADQPRFTLVEGDVLAGKHTLNPELIETWQAQRADCRGHGRLVANLPYQVATPLLMELLIQRPDIATLTCTIQKEVGDRLLAEHGSRDYGPVSVVARTLATVTRVALLPPQAFWPRPKVDSVAIHIERKASLPFAAEQSADFAALLQQAFTQRRKMLRVALRPVLGERAAELLSSTGLDPTLRPESLPPSAWHALFAAARR